MTWNSNRSALIQYGDAALELIYDIGSCKGIFSISDLTFDWNISFNAGRFNLNFQLCNAQKLSSFTYSIFEVCLSRQCKSSRMKTHTSIWNHLSEGKPLAEFCNLSWQQSSYVEPLKMQAKIFWKLYLGMVIRFILAMEVVSTNICLHKIASRLNSVWSPCVPLRTVRIDVEVVHLQ